MTRREFVFSGISTASLLGIADGFVRSSVGGMKISMIDKKSDDKFPYVSDGLVSMWDGIWRHHDQPDKWVDLVTGLELSILGGCEWTDNSLRFNGTSGYAFADTPIGFWSHVKTLDVSLTFLDQPASCRAVTIGDEDGNLCIGLGGYRLCGYTNPLYRRVPNASLVPSLRGVTRVKSSGSVPWYVDGQAVQSDNGNWFTAGSNGGIVFGTSVQGTLFFKGEIRCVRLYDRPLTEDEIAYNYSVDKERFGI